MEALKALPSEIYGDQMEKPLRLCIDGKQIVEIEDIEVIPRGTDVTLFITCSQNIGTAPQVPSDLAYPMVGDIAKEEPTEAPKEKKEQLITMNTLKETFQKEEDELDEELKQNEDNGGQDTDNTSGED